MECQRDSGAWLEFERVQQRGGATKLPIQIPCKGLWKGRGSRKFLKGSQVPGHVDVLDFLTLHLVWPRCLFISMNTNYIRNKNTVLHRESRWYFMSCVLLTRSTANEWKRLWQGKKASFENTWNTWRRLASWQRRKLSRFGKVKEWWNLRAMWSRSRSGAGGTTEEFLGFFSQSVIYRFRLLECSDLWIWTNDWYLKSEARWRYFWNLLDLFWLLIPQPDGP